MRVAGTLTEACECKPSDANAAKKNVRNTSNNFSWRHKTEIKEKKLLIYPFFLPGDKRRVLYLYVLFLIGQGSNVSSKHQTIILFSTLFRKKESHLIHKISWKKRN